MNIRRTIVLAGVLIGISIGLMLSSYLHSPEEFSLVNHLSSVFLILGMVVFVIAHYKTLRDQGTKR